MLEANDHCILRHEIQGASSQVVCTHFEGPEKITLSVKKKLIIFTDCPSNKIQLSLAYSYTIVAVCSAAAALNFRLFARYNFIVLLLKRALASCSLLPSPLMAELPIWVAA